MPGENPILNNPYEEPLLHFATNLVDEFDYRVVKKGGASSPPMCSRSRFVRGRRNLAHLGPKKKAEKTLKIGIDEEAFARLYGHQSHPFHVTKGQQIAIRVISQFGEETTKVVTV